MWQVKEEIEATKFHSAQDIEVFGIDLKAVLVRLEGQ